MKLLHVDLFLKIAIEKKYFGCTLGCLSLAKKFSNCNLSKNSKFHFDTRLLLTCSY